MPRSNSSSGVRVSPDSASRRSSASVAGVLAQVADEEPRVDAREVAPGLDPDFRLHEARVVVSGRTLEERFVRGRTASDVSGSAPRNSGAAVRHGRRSGEGRGELAVDLDDPHAAGVAGHPAVDDEDLGDVARRCPPSPAGPAPRPARPPRRAPDEFPVAKILRKIPRNGERRRGPRASRPGPGRSPHAGRRTRPPAAPPPATCRSCAGVAAPGPVPRAGRGSRPPPRTARRARAGAFAASSGASATAGSVVRARRTVSTNSP